MTEEEFRNGQTTQPDTTESQTGNGADAATSGVNTANGATSDDTIVGTVAGDQVGVDANGNDVLLKDGEEVILNKSDITDAPDSPQETAIADSLPQSSEPTVAPEGYATSQAPTSEVSPSLNGTKPILQVPAEEAASVPAPEQPKSEETEAA